MSFPSREVSISYNGLTLGGSSQLYRLTDPFAFHIDRDTISLQAHVIIQADTEANFLIAEAALCVAFRAAKGTLVVSLGSATRYSFSHAANSGMNARGSANKPGSSLDTNISALYVVSVMMERPWDFSGEGGLRTSSVSLQTGTSGLRALTVAGQYSATSGNSATANHDNAVTGAEAYCQGWLSTFAVVTSDRTSVLQQPDKENKVCDFSRTYVELGFAKVDGSNDVTFRDPELVVDFSQGEFGSYSPVARRPVDVRAAYQAVVVFPHDPVQQTPAAINLASPQDLKTFVQTKLEPRLMQQIRRLGDITGPVCVVSRSPRYEPFTNRVSVAWTLIMYPASLIEQRVQVEEVSDEGEVLTPVWDASEWAKDTEPAPRTWDRRVTITQSLLQDGPVSSSSDLVPPKAASDQGLAIVQLVDPLDLVGNERFRLVSRRRLRERSYMGTVINGTAAGGTQTVRVTFETWELAYTRLDTPKDGFSPSVSTADVTGGAGTGAGAPSSVGDSLLPKGNP